MVRNSKELIRKFSYSCLLIGLGMAVGFHILPYYFTNKWMDVSMETGIDTGRFSIIHDLKTRASAVVKNNVVLIYPDTATTFYFIVKRGDK